MNTVKKIIKYSEKSIIILSKNINGKLNNAGNEYL